VGWGSRPSHTHTPCESATQQPPGRPTSQAGSPQLLDCSISSKSGSGVSAGACQLRAAALSLRLLWHGRGGAAHAAPARCRQKAAAGQAELTQAELTQAELTQAELTQAELTQAGGALARRRLGSRAPPPCCGIAASAAASATAWRSLPTLRRGWAGGGWRGAASAATGSTGCWSGTGRRQRCTAAPLRATASTVRPRGPAPAPACAPSKRALHVLARCHLGW
jgi:hypothetical protein